MRELSMRPPMGRRALGQVMRETVRRNRVREGSVYLQVSRGSAPRDFLFPAESVPRSVMCVARNGAMAKGDALAEKGIGVITTPDLRWGRPDIKTVQLLAPAMAKEKAKAVGAKEAWLVDRDGFITEGASSNAWIVNDKREVITRSVDGSILKGVTRTVLLELMRKHGLTLIERSFSLEEARKAREAFVTSATNFVMPVVSIDGVPLGNGSPGLVTCELRSLVLAAARSITAV